MLNDFLGALGVPKLVHERYPYWVPSIKVWVCFGTRHSPIVSLLHAGKIYLYIVPLK